MWLSPSYWSVEGQLSYVRTHRADESLQWARNMSEFQTWRTSDPNDIQSRERTLWIRGTLGIGKSFLVGYMIDLLRCLHPDAIVLYFFCKVDQLELIKSRDIVRTLAYQHLLENNKVRPVLEDLQKKKLLLDQVGIGFLFQKLLQEPLLLAKGDIYIILDGLDEADLTTVDEIERVLRPEIDVLLGCLSTLPSVRLLFVSRPNFDVSQIVRNMIVKPIGAENQNDIDTYVEQALSDSRRLQEGFKNAED